eukprot:s266_g5.t1
MSITWLSVRGFEETEQHTNWHQQLSQMCSIEHPFVARCLGSETGGISDGAWDPRNTNDGHIMMGSYNCTEDPAYPHAVRDFALDKAQPQTGSACRLSLQTFMQVSGSLEGPTPNAQRLLPGLDFDGS